MTAVGQLDSLDTQDAALSLLHQSSSRLRAPGNTIWNLIRDGHLPSFTVNRRRLIARAALEAFMEVGGTEGHE